MPNLSVLIFFGFFFYIIFVLKNQNSKKIENELNNIQNIGLKLIHEMNNVQCVTFISGAKNNNFSFKKADLYFYENAFLIVGFFKIGKYKFYKSAFLLSQNEYLKNNLKSFEVIAPKNINLNFFNKDVYIEFGESNFTNTNVEIRLKNLNEEEKNLIKI